MMVEMVVVVVVVSGGDDCGLGVDSGCNGCRCGNTCCGDKMMVVHFFSWSGDMIYFLY